MLLCNIFHILHCIVLLMRIVYVHNKATHVRRNWQMITNSKSAVLEASESNRCK